MSIARILAAALAVILPIGAQASTLTEQALCDAKAEQAYKKLLLVEQLSKDSSGYTNHYDEKCFMGVEAHTTAGSTIRFVLTRLADRLMQATHGAASPGRNTGRLRR